MFEGLEMFDTKLNTFADDYQERVGELQNSHAGLVKQLSDITQQQQQIIEHVKHRRNASA